MGGASCSFTKIGNMEIQIIPMTRAILGFAIAVKVREIRIRSAKIIFKIGFPITSLLCLLSLLDVKN